PAGAGTRTARPAVVRPARIRPVLEASRRDRRAGDHARLRQRIFPVRQRLGGFRRVPAVPAFAVPLLLQPGPQPGRGRGRCAGLPRTPDAVSRASNWHGGELNDLAATTTGEPQGYPQKAAAALRRGSGGGYLSLHLLQSVLGGERRRTRQA